MQPGQALPDTEVGRTSVMIGAGNELFPPSARKMPGPALP
jgi:hypothetical protein